MELVRTTLKMLSMHYANLRMLACSSVKPFWECSRANVKRSRTLRWKKSFLYWQVNRKKTKLCSKRFNQSTLLRRS